jgi:hypothetical protein
VTKILESDEDKTVVQEIFKRIDAFTEDFHVRFNAIRFSAIKRLILYSQLEIIMSVERDVEHIKDSVSVRVSYRT